MDQGKINVRYARAFFMLAKEKGLTSELRNDAALVASVCADSLDLGLLLDSPVVKTSQKTKVFRSIFSGKVNELTLNFLLLIAENKREKNIPGIFRVLEDLYRQEEGVKAAVLTSAQALTDEMAEQIRKILEKELEARVELSRKVDESLIGGFVLRVDDRQFDASISTQLKKIKEQLLQTELK